MQFNLYTVALYFQGAIIICGICASNNIIWAYIATPYKCMCSEQTWYFSAKKQLLDSIYTLAVIDDSILLHWASVLLYINLYRFEGAWEKYQHQRAIIIYTQDFWKKRRSWINEEVMLCCMEHAVSGRHAPVWNILTAQKTQLNFAPYNILRMSSFFSGSSFTVKSKSLLFFSSSSLFSSVPWRIKAVSYEAV